MVTSCGKILLAKRNQSSEFCDESEVLLPIPGDSKVTQAWYARSKKRLIYEVVQEFKYTLYSTTLPPESESIKTSSMGESKVLCVSRLRNEVYILQSEILVLTGSPTGLYYLFNMDEVTYNINGCHLLILGTKAFKLRHELGSSLGVAVSRCCSTWRAVPEEKRKPRCVLRSASQIHIAVMLEDASLLFINDSGEDRRVQLSLTDSLDEMKGGFVSETCVGIAYAKSVVLHDLEGASIQKIDYNNSVRGVWFSDVSTSQFGVWTSSTLYRLNIHCADHGSKEVLQEAVQCSASQANLSKDLLMRCVTADIHSPAILVALFSQDKVITGNCSPQKELFLSRCDNSFFSPSALSDQLDPLVKESWQLDRDLTEAWQLREPPVSDVSASVIESLFQDKASNSLISFREAAESDPNLLILILLKTLGLVDQDLDAVCLKRWAQLVSFGSRDCNPVYRVVLNLVTKHNPELLMSFVRVAQAVSDRQPDAAFRSPGQMYDLSARIFQSLVTLDTLDEKAMEAGAEIFLMSSLEAKEILAFELFRRAKCWLKLKDLSLACPSLQSASLRRLYEAKQMPFVVDVLRAQAQYLPLHQLLLDLKATFGSTSSETVEAFGGDLSFGDVRSLLLTSFENEMRDSLSVI